MCKSQEAQYRANARARTAANRQRRLDARRRGQSSWMRRLAAAVGLRVRSA